MNGRGPVSDLRLERYRLGELPAGDAAALRETLANDEVLRQRLAALERSDALILEAYPPAEVAAAVQRRRAALDLAAASDRPRRPRARVLFAAPVAIGLLTVVTGVLLLRGSLPGAGGSAKDLPAADRPKGGAPDLLLYRKGGELAVERLAPGAVARPQDVVQIAYQAGGRRYGVIFSIDGRGVVTRHLPASGEEAAPLQGGGAVALATAYRLDDAPRLERFYLVAADEPFAVSSALTAARDAGLDPSTTDRLPLGREFAQASFLLRKE